MLHEFLVSRGGLLNFFHDHLRLAVEAKYLTVSGDVEATASKHEQAHRKLAVFFGDRTADHSDKRRCDELPFQLMKSRDFTSLKDCLSDLDLLNVLFTPETEYDFLEYWSILTREIGANPVEIYQQKLDAKRDSWVNPVETTPSSDNENAVGSESASLNRSLLESLELVARVVYKLGYRKESEALYKEALSIRRLSDKKLVNEDAVYSLSEAYPHSTLPSTDCDNVADLLIPEFYDTLEEAFAAACTFPDMGGIMYYNSRFNLRKGSQIASTESTSECMSWLILEGPKSNEYILHDLLKQVPVKDLLSWNSLAQVCKEQGKIEEAIQNYLEVIKRLKQPMFFKQWWVLICAYYGLADACVLSGQAYEADGYLSAALHLSRVILGKAHPFVAVGLAARARMTHARGAFDEALPMMKEAVRIMETSLGKNHPSTAIAYNNLACMYFDKAQYTKAFALFEDAVKVLRANVKSGADKLIKLLLNLGIVAHAQNNIDIAESIFREAKDVMTANIDSESKRLSMFPVMQSCLSAYPSLL